MSTHAFSGVLALFLLSACGTTAATTGATAAQTDDAVADADAAPADVAADDAGTDATGTDATGTDAVAADVSTQPSVTKTTKSGTYSVVLTGPTSLKSGQKGVYVAAILDANGDPVTGISVKIGFIHSTMGHGGSGVPVAKDNGDGTWNITGIQPSMGGVWWLQVKIGTDVAQFDIKVG